MYGQGNAGTQKPVSGTSRNPLLSSAVKMSRAAIALQDLEGNFVNGALKAIAAG